MIVCLSMLALWPACEHWDRLWHNRYPALDKQKKMVGSKEHKKGIKQKKKEVFYVHECNCHRRKPTLKQCSVETVTFTAFLALTVSMSASKHPSNWFNPQTVWDWLLLNMKFLSNCRKTEKSQNIYTTVLSGNDLNVSWHWYYNHTLHGRLSEKFLREAWSINILLTLKINCLQWSKTTVLSRFPLKFKAARLKAPDFKHCWFSGIS